MKKGNYCLNLLTFANLKDKARKLVLFTIFKVLVLAISMNVHYLAYTKIPNYPDKGLYPNPATLKHTRDNPLIFLTLTKFEFSCFGLLFFLVFVDG